MKRNGITKWVGMLVLTTCLMILSSAARAVEYYVSTVGDDSTGNGSIDNPFRTIQHVLDAAAGSGDTITLRGGTYNESIRIRYPDMTLRSRSGEWAVIESPIDNEDIGQTVRFDVDADGSALQRIEVIGGYYYGIKFETKWDWGDPSDRSGACSIVIEDCKIHHTGNACSKVTPGCDDITIRGCEIHHSGRQRPDSAEAIDNVNGDRMLVQQCHIHDIPATGLYAKGGAIGVKIERCLLEGCGEAGILVGFDTSPEYFDTDVNPDYYENIDGEVTNCIVVDTQYSGIGMYAARDPKIYNNTLVDVAKSGHSGLYFGLTYQDWEPEAGRPPSVNPILRNNIVAQSAAQNATAVHIRWNGELGGMSALSGSPTMSNNRYYIQGGAAEFVDQRPGSEFSGDLAAWKAHISGDADSTQGDPGLVDLPAGNYHLSAISPCIDAGTSVGAPNVDYEGCTRPQGGGVDIGAYEYMGVVYVSPDGLCDGKTPCYSTIQEGIDWDGLMFTIKAAHGVYGENIVLDQSKKVFFQGAWDAAFTTDSGATQIDSMTISNGTMVVDKGCLTIGGN